MGSSRRELGPVEIKFIHLLFPRGHLNSFEKKYNFKDKMYRFGFCLDSRPALGHGFGKQMPSAIILFSRTNLLYVPSIEM